jgi:hypothetical protein
MKRVIQGAALSKSVLLATTAGLMALLGAGASFADSPHFISATGGIVASTGDYLASFKEAGLGNTPITYDLAADTSYEFQCFTKSNNKPQGSPNAGGPSSENTQTTITPRNGQITATILLDVTFPPTNVSCQGGGLKLCLVSASYTNVTLTDTTDNVEVNLPNGSISAPAGSFIACSDT